MNMTELDNFFIKNLKYENVTVPVHVNRFFHRDI